MRILLAISAALLLSACSFVKLTPGGEIDDGAMGKGMDLLKGLLG